MVMCVCLAARLTCATALFIPMDHVVRMAFFLLAALACV